MRNNQIQQTEENIYIPAVVAEYFTDQELDAERRQAVGDAIMFMLPELTAIRLARFVKLGRALKYRIIKTVDQLKKYLSEITEGFKVIDIRKVGIKVLFRGTTRNLNGEIFLGNNNTISNGISTATDPVRAVIFGIESGSKAGRKGVFQYVLTDDIQTLELLAPNRRVAIETEVVLKIGAEEFGKLPVKEIPIEQARKLVKEVFNIDLPPRITDHARSLELLENLPITNLKKSYEFYIKLSKL